jgi:hypothetical protein
MAGPKMSWRRARQALTSLTIRDFRRTQAVACGFAGFGGRICALARGSRVAGCRMCGR